MNNPPRLASVDLILKGLKKSKRELCRLAEALPDEDAYATPYSILADAVKHLDEIIQELKPSLKDAKGFRKEHPEQSLNRAKTWCKINGKPKRKDGPVEGDGAGSGTDQG